MSSIAIAGDTSGIITIQAPAVAGSTVLTLPTTSATLLTDSSGILNIGAGQIYKDASGNMGIGTSSVASRLSIKGTTTTDAPILGAELISGGTWTLGAGWTGDNTVGFTHASGSGTSNLSYSFIPTIGAKYVVSWTQLVGGSVFGVGFGGTGPGVNMNSSNSWYVIAISAGVLTINPNNLFSGTLVLSIKQIIAISTPAMSVLDSTGTSTLETRTGSSSNPNNTFIGLLSGGYTTGSLNVGLGNGALQNNFTGRANTAVGYQSLQSNTGSANSNTQIWNSFTGNFNSAVGYRALYLNSTGGDNSAFGFSALQNNTTGSYNSAVGYQALLGNTTGANNSAVGYNSGSAITTGSNNVVIGGYIGAAAPIYETGSNYIVLSDGAGNVRQTHNASGSLAFDTAGTAFGTSGQVLQSNGNAAVPTWVTPAVVAAAAGTLTGTTLATNVVTSSLTSVGQLNLLTVKGTTASDAPILGAELISGGTWTLGAGWSGDNTVGFTHAPGYTANLSYSFIPTIGTKYRFSSNISGHGGGQWGLGFAGGAYGTQGGVGYVHDIVATTATPITVTAWDSNLVTTLYFSIKQIIAVSTPAMSVLDSTGTSRVEVRAGSPNNTFIGLLSGGYTTAGSFNVGLGDGALQNNLEGGSNTAVGYQAMMNSLASNNTAVGYSALKANTTGNNNSAFGVNALSSNTIGTQNTASGASALLSNTTGINNSAVGTSALQSNTTGGNNTASGTSALQSNTTGTSNSAEGVSALFANTTGNSNSAIGAGALLSNTTGANNVAVGFNALTVNTTGVATFGAITAGTLYTNGTYNGVAMSAVSGATFAAYPTVNITVAGGVVTVCTLVTAGTRATVTTTTVLTVAAALIGGTGSGFTIPVATFAQGANNSAFGASAGSAIKTGSNNVVIGSYTGAAAPISLTGSNFIVLSDGAGTVRQTHNASGSLAFDTAGTAFGTSGQVLQSNGNAAVPTWVTPAVVAAAAGTLTGATLASNVLASSLTSVGTLAGLTVTANATINGLTVGKGAGTGSNNAAFGINALLSNTTGYENTAIGDSALYSNTTGSRNTANGSSALKSNTTATYNTASGAYALLNNTTGNNNTASGVSALQNNTTGNDNTASGVMALYYNSTGTQNTANGKSALQSNSTGNSNTASGRGALQSNTTGYENTASGATALYSNTTGNENTASGVSALFSNTTGSSNTASGAYALVNNTTGGQNTANGRGALQSNTTGYYNTASGVSALYYNTTGTNNVSVGYQALYSNTTSGDNSALGYQALLSNTTGVSNTALGSSALRGNTTGASNTALGQAALIANSTGSNNSYVGIAAGYENRTGSSNSCVGSGAIQNNVSGGSNVAFGVSALNRLRGSSYNIAIGVSALFASGDLVYMSVGLVVGVSYGIYSLGTGSQANWNTLAGTSGITYIVDSIFTCASSAVLGDGVVYNNATKNVAIGYNSGSSISSGSNNVIIGGYTGLATPISATGNNFIVLSDGAGTVRQTHNASGSLAFDTAGTAFGTAGQVLQSNGNAAVPTWVTPAGGASALTILSKSAAYTVVAGDLGKVINCSGTITISLTAAATLGAGFYCTIANVDGNNIVTIDPSGSETLNGYSTWVLNGSQSVQLYCTGTAFNLISGQPTFFAERPYVGVFTRPVASSNEAIAIGDSAVASGGAAMAIGVGANASGGYGLALGRSATVSIIYGTAIGANSAGSGSVAATGSGAMALGGSYASGADSFAAAGANNTSSYGATGANSIAIGQSCKATGTGSVCIGSNSSDYGIASGSRSICLGSTFALASGTGSVAIGQGAQSVLTYKYVFGGGAISNSNAGECQSSIMHFVGLTTDATPKKLTSQSNTTATAINQLILPNNSAINFRIQVIALQKAADGTGVAGYTFTGVIRRGADAASTALLASAKTVDYESVVGWDCVVTADTTNGGLSVTATGAATTNIRWVATCWSSEVNAYA